MALWLTLTTVEHRSNASLIAVEELIAVGHARCEAVRRYVVRRRSFRVNDRACRKIVKVRTCSRASHRADVFSIGVRIADHPVQTEVVVVAC